MKRPTLTPPAPKPARQTALEAMTALYRILPESAAAGWERDVRRGRWKATRLSALCAPWRS